MANLTHRATARPFARMAKGSATSLQTLVAPSWRASFVTAIVLLLVAGGLAVRQYQRFSTASARVEHAYQVLTAIDELQTRVVDGETALRGYLLTHDASFLGPFEGVEVQAAALADRLVTLVTDNPQQLERAKQVSTEVATKITEMANVRSTDAAGGLDAGAARMAEGRGRETMDRVRALAADMRAAENSLLAAGARQAALARRAGLGFGIVSLIVAAVLGLVGLSVNRTFERRRIAFEAELAGRLAAERSAASASEELLESESLNRSILDSSGDCITLLEPDGRIASMNAPGLQMLGIDDVDALKDRLWLDLWGTSGAQAGQAVSDALAKGEGRFQGTTRTRHGRRWWDVIVTPVRDGAGDITKLLCTSRDITERKRAEDAVRESEQQFRTLSDTLPQIVWSTRPDGYHDYYNERWYEYTGMPRPDEPGGERDAAGGEGWNWTDYLHPADLDAALKAWTDSLHDGSPYSVEYRVKRHDGAYRWFVVRALPFRDGAGTITRWFGTSTDIDDQKRADDERTLLLASERAARSEAERAARMKDEFVSTLSHELRTPLNAIVGWTGVLKHDQSPETLAKGLAVIDRNLRRQSQMIDDLLDVSRIISGKMRLDVKRVELASIIEEAVASAQPAADAKGVRLITVLRSAAFIQGDPGRLQQVVWNLVANGIKFTPKGGVVEVILQRMDGHVHIQVSDSGQGIAPEFLQHVFQRFRQGDASITRVHGGLGLGLAIVKNLVEMHGGSVDAASDGVGRGSTFTVRLPLALTNADAQKPDGLADTLRLDPSRFSHLLSGVVVLVVDDEPDSRELMQRLLEDAGARVSIASGAREACAQLEQGFVPDIIISDIGMPELDGYDFMRQVRWMNGPVASVPAAALTALARVEDRKRALMAGYQTHLSKPVDPAELVATVASLTRRTGRLPS